MATSQAQPQTEFSNCIRQGRRNACAEVKFSTCETADKTTEGAAKADSPAGQCPIHVKEGLGSSASGKET